MLPKFSIEASRLTITFPCAIRLAPWARLILMIAGNSCGVSPTASAKRKEERVQDRTRQIDIDGKDGDHQHQRHFHQEIAESA